MKTIIAAVVLIVALLSLLVFQQRTIRRLESRVTEVVQENNELQFAKSLEAVQNPRPDLANEDSATLISRQEQQSPELQAEIIRLRNLAGRALRAEAELAQRKSDRDSASVPNPSSLQRAPSPDAMTTYLGKPVLPPSNLDPAYQREGLLSAMQKAAQDAGVPLMKLEVETNEFPCLIGIVVSGAADFEKLKLQLSDSSQHKFHGVVGSHGSYALDLTPPTIRPAEGGQYMNARSTMRMQILAKSLGNNPP